MIPSPCPGLIPCTPIPTRAPTGLTHDEAVAVGQVLAAASSAIVVLIVVALVIASSIVLYLVTKGDS